MFFDFCHTGSSEDQGQGSHRYTWDTVVRCSEQIWPDSSENRKDIDGTDQ